MLSINSGRRGVRPLVEDSLSLDLAWLMRLAPIRAGQAGSGKIEWAVDGNAIGSLRFRLNMQQVENARLMLRYCPARPGGVREPIRQEIALTHTVQHFGGRRWWMRCPATGERVRTLHLPPGGDRFASRKVWKLTYRLEQLNRFDRPFEKLFCAQRRLGNAQGLGTGLQRPRGMWRRTFARHAERFEELDIACMEKIATLIEDGAA